MDKDSAHIEKGLFQLFNNKPVRRYTISGFDTSVDSNVGLDLNVRPTIRSLGGTVGSSVAPLYDPYAEKFESGIDFEFPSVDVKAFVVRSERVKIDQTEYKQHVAKKEKELNRKISKDERANIIDKLSFNAPVHFTFTPVVIDSGNKYVYVFTKSKSLCEEALDYAYQIFGVEVSNCEITSYCADFLTWCIWMNEMNYPAITEQMNANAIESPVFIGRAVCENADWKLSCSEGEESFAGLKAFLGKGNEVESLEMCVSQSGSVKVLSFITSLDKDFLKKISIPMPSFEDNSGALFTIIAEVRNAFRIMEVYETMYNTDGAVFTHEVRANWGLKKFCPLEIGEF